MTSHFDRVCNDLGIFIPPHSMKSTWNRRFSRNEQLIDIFCLYFRSKCWCDSLFRSKLQLLLHMLLSFFRDLLCAIQEDIFEGFFGEWCLWFDLHWKALWLVCFDNCWLRNSRPALFQYWVDRRRRIWISIYFHFLMWFCS